MNSLKKIGFWNIAFFVFLLFISWKTLTIMTSKNFFLNPPAAFSFEPIFYNFNLIIHEFSHLLFIPLGEFMHMLGGTIGEFIFPVLFLICALRDSQQKVVSFCLLWIGFNIITTAVYMKDAVRLEIPLLMQDARHDWLYIFGRLKVLNQAEIIGNITLAIGIGFVLLALLTFCFFCYNMLYIKRA